MQYIARNRKIAAQRERAARSDIGGQHTAGREQGAARRRAAVHVHDVGPAGEIDIPHQRAAIEIDDIGPGPGGEITRRRTAIQVDRGNTATAQHNIAIHRARIGEGDVMVAGFGDLSRNRAGIGQ